MAWRTVVISNPARLRIENDQLLIVQDSEVGLPVEDIAVLMIESPQVLLSSALLNRLAELDVLLLVCDRRHLPSMAGISFAGHSRLAGVQRLQLEMSDPFRKRCWQAIVVRKITNQAACLEILGRDRAPAIRLMAGHVASGDSANIESVAAREHFHAAFGPDFIRGDEDGLNAALNYGYAVMRGAVARGLALHGFLLAQGIHHHSELNAFNLADDFIEPLRPLVDLSVAGMEIGEELAKTHREALAGLLHTEVLVDGQHQTALHAAEMMAGSFLSACKAGDPHLLKLPELLPIKTHDYE